MEMNLASICQVCGKLCVFCGNCQFKFDNFVSSFHQTNIQALQRCVSIYSRFFIQPVRVEETILSDYFAFDNVKFKLKFKSEATRIAKYLSATSGKENELSSRLGQFRFCCIVIFRAALNWPSMSEGVQKYVRTNALPCGHRRSAGDPMGDFFDLFLDLSLHCEDLCLVQTEISIVHAMFAHAADYENSAEFLRMETVLRYYQLLCPTGANDPERLTSILHLYSLTWEMVKFVGASRLSSPLIKRYNDFHIAPSDLKTLRCLLYSHTNLLYDS